MSQSNLTSTMTIPCTVSLGMFSTERGVLINLPGGGTVSALVDRRDVIIDKEPPPGGQVQGRVHVVVVEAKDDSVIVDLPQPGLMSGPRLRVPKAFVR